MHPTDDPAPEAPPPPKPAHARPRHLGAAVLLVLGLGVVYVLVTHPISPMWMIHWALDIPGMMWRNIPHGAMSELQQAQQDNAGAIKGIETASEDLRKAILSADVSRRQALDAKAEIARLQKERDTLRAAGVARDQVIKQKDASIDIWAARAADLEAALAAQQARPPVPMTSTLAEDLALFRAKGYLSK